MWWKNCKVSLAIHSNTNYCIVVSLAVKTGFDTDHIGYPGHNTRLVSLVIFCFLGLLTSIFFTSF